MASEFAVVGGDPVVPEHPRADARDFRDALGHYASGVTVIAGLSQGRPVGFTCQSFYSVSLDPPLVSFSVMTTSTSYPRIRESGGFAVNVLSYDQRRISDGFARTGTDKWADVEWTATRTGNPVVGGTLMWLDCSVWAEQPAGDHLIVIGRVLEHGVTEQPGRDPLLFFNGRYRRLTAFEAQGR